MPPPPLQRELQAGALFPLVALPLWVALLVPMLASWGMQALYIYPMYTLFGAVAGGARGFCTALAWPFRMASRVPALLAALQTHRGPVVAAWRAASLRPST